MPGEETVRLHQANERTLLAWIRTGIAIMAFGFAIARFGVFLRQVALVNPATVRAPHSLGSTWVGATLVALGVLANLFATMNFARVRRAIEQGQLGAPSPILAYAIGATATLVGIAMTVLLLGSLGQP
jgi:putative membrane protein